LKESEFIISALANQAKPFFPAPKNTAKKTAQNGASLEMCGHERRFISPLCVQGRTHQ
jgi:hypothetical protein